MNTTFPIHFRTASGLENLLAEEIRALGFENVEIGSRSITALGDKSLLYKANLWCRTAIRILKPLHSFPAKDEKALYDGVREVDWSKWVSENGTIAFSADVRSSFTSHSLYISQLAKDAVVDQFREKTGKRPSVDTIRPDLRIVVSLFNNMVQVFLDSSGESLHKRGYRTKAGEAPISEAVAAAIIKNTEWNISVPLVDAMTGSGTLLIEAGLIARNIAPGIFRSHFGFQSWPDYEPALFKSVLEEAKKSIRREIKPKLIGLEIDPITAGIARENIERAGLSDMIKIETTDFFGWESKPETPGVLVMNPPYDERMGVSDIADFYQKIGDRLKETFGGWKAYVFTGNIEAIKYISLRSSKRIPLFNGPIEGRLLEFEMREGSEKREIVRTENPKWLEKALVFKNRLEKNKKNIGKRAEREKITNYRIYDWDIPELPFVLEIFGDRLRFVEVPRNTENSPLEQKQYIKLMLKTASEVLSIPIEKIHHSIRRSETDTTTELGDLLIRKEGDLSFAVDVTSPMETGLELDLRKFRSFIKDESKDKDVLNLFCGTGTISVYAAAGGAKKTVNVAMSDRHLEWTRKNLYLNGFSGPEHSYVREESDKFLLQSKQSFDICIAIVPSRFSDHSEKLIEMIKRKMKPGGKIYFLSSREDLKLEAKEINYLLAPFDFEKKPVHKGWLISL